MNNTSDITVKAEIAELRPQLTETINRVSRTEASLEQLNKSIAAGNRMTAWQFISFIVVMAGTLLGSMYWATGVLEKRFDERFTQMEKRFDERLIQMEKRFDERFIQMERRFDERFVQMEKRFEDLRQVVLSKR
ncbi:MAG: hypothetical protein L0226_11045 [Acidobacteria bacterium]|nr:hypothetical protein [Acidobacteriota bacterium]